MYDPTDNAAPIIPIEIVAGNIATDNSKKHDKEMALKLVKCPDILKSVTDLEEAPFTVGFAAETENLMEFLIKELQGSLIFNWNQSAALKTTLHWERDVV